MWSSRQQTANSKQQTANSKQHISNSHPERAPRFLNGESPAPIKIQGGMSRNLGFRLGGIRKGGTAVDINVGGRRVNSPFSIGDEFIPANAFIALHQHFAPPGLVDREGGAYYKHSAPTEPLLSSA